MRIISRRWLEKMLDLMMVKTVYFYDPRIRQGWGKGDYVVNILSCRPGRRHHHQYEAYLGGRDRLELLIRAKRWVDWENKKNK